MHVLLEQRAQIGASDVPKIVNGTKEQLPELYEVKRGTRPPADLSDVWEVQRGKREEPHIIAWREKELGYEFIYRQHIFRHPEYEWLSGTIDAFDPVREAVVEVKT